jgi:hypothetical protein
LLSPEEFTPFAIPFVTNMTKQQHNPCELPKDYELSLQQKSRTVLVLKQQIINCAAHLPQTAVLLQNQIEQKFHVCNLVRVSCCFLT